MLVTTVSDTGPHTPADSPLVLEHWPEDGLTPYFGAPAFQTEPELWEPPRPTAAALWLEQPLLT